MWCQTLASCGLAPLPHEHHAQVASRCTVRGTESWLPGFGRCGAAPSLRFAYPIGLPGMHHCRCVAAVWPRPRCQGVRLCVLALLADGGGIAWG
jgi:hypothetical protein